MEEMINKLRSHRSMYQAKRMTRYLRGRPALTAFLSVLLLASVATAGFLTPSAAPGSTFATLGQLFDSITSGTYDSSTLVADQNGSVIEHLIWIEENLGWASSSNNVYNLSSNVGIGDQTPETEFEVVGTASVSTLLIGGLPIAADVASDLDFDDFLNAMTLDAELDIASNGFGFDFGGDASISGSLDLTTVRPRVVGSISGAGAPTYLSSPWDVHVVGKYAYVVSQGSDYLTIVDVSVPSSPSLASTVYLGAFARARGVFVAGNYAYTANHDTDTLSIVDITDPSNAYVVGSLTDGTTLNAIDDVYVVGRYAYVLGRLADSFAVIDVADPTSPTLVGSFSHATLYDNLHSLAVQGRYAYFTAGGITDALYVVDIADPTNPTVVGSELTNEPAGLWVSGKYAYTVNFGGDIFTVIDISDPTNPTTIAQLTDSVNLNGAFDVEVAGTLAYVTTYSNSGVTVVDVSDPYNPTVVSALSDSTNLFRAKAIWLAGKYAYVTSAGSRLTIVDIGGLDAPTANIGALQSSTLDVTENIDVGNDLRVRNGIIAAELGIHGFSFFASDSWFGKHVSVSGNFELGGTVSSHLTPTVNDTYSLGTSALRWSDLYVASGSLHIGESGNEAIIGYSTSGTQGLIFKPDGSTTTLTLQDGGTADLMGNFLPTADLTYGIGDATHRWLNLFTNNASISNNLEVTNIASVSQLYVGGTAFTGLASLSATVEITGDGTHDNLKLTESDSGLTYGFVVNDGDFFVRAPSSSATFSENWNILSVASNSLAMTLGTPASPSIVGTYNTSGDAFDIYVSGKYAYVADEQSGLQVIDISEPTAPAQVGNYSIGGGYSNYSAFVSGRYFYTGDDSGIEIIDVTDPSAPTLVTQFNTSGGGSGLDVDISGMYAYVAHSNGMRVIDVTDPSAPHEIASTSTAGAAKNIYVSGRYAYMAAGTTGLVIYDISNPASPSLVDAFSIGGEASDVYVSGRYAYVTDSFPASLKVIDVSDPSAPVLTGTLSTIDAVNVYVSGRYAYVTAWTDGLLVIDISDPSAPTLVRAVDISGEARGVYVSGRYVYVAAGPSGGLQIIDIGGVETHALYAGNISTSDVTVDESIDIGNSLYVRNGANIGPGGLYVQGFSAFASASEFGDDVTIWGNASASAYFGAGLVDCDNATNSKLLWDVSTGTFSCGTDQTGGGGGVASNSLDFDEFVDGTMTLDGNLKIASHSSGYTIDWEPYFISDLIPNVDDTYALGDSTHRWSDLYVASGSLHIGTAGDEGVIGYDTTNGALTFAPDGASTSAWFHDDGSVSFGGYVGVGIDDPETILHINVGSVSSDATFYAGPSSASFSSLVRDSYMAYSENVFGALDETTQTIALLGAGQTNTATSGAVNGVYGLAQSTHGAGTLGYVYAVEGDAVHSGAGTVSRLWGLVGSTQNTGPGTVTEAAGIHVYPGANTGGGTISNAYGLLIQDQSGVGTQAWNIYSSGSGRNYFGGNVGIGVTTPLTELDVSGSASISDNFELSGTVSSNLTPTVHDSFTLGTDTARWADLYLGPASLHLGATGDEGVIGYDTTNNELIFQPGGSTRVTMEAGGNVGVGTTAPAEALEVIGEVRIDNTGGGTGSCLRFDGSNLAYSDDCSAYTNFSSISAGAGGWTDDGAVVRLTTAADNVGIGTTGAPAKLTVRAVNTGDKYLQIASSSGAIVLDVLRSGTLRGLQLDIGQTPGLASELPYNALRDFNGGGGHTTYLNDATDLWVHGTLEVDDPAFFDSWASISGSLSVGNTSAASVLTLPAFNHYETSPVYTFAGDTDTGMFRPHAAADAVAFTTGGTERMRIMSDGNIGLGTTIATRKVQIDGGSLYVKDGHGIFRDPILVGGFAVGGSRSYNAFYNTNAGATQTSFVNDDNDIWVQGSLEVDNRVWFETHASVGGDLTVGTVNGAQIIKLPASNHYATSPVYTFFGDEDTGMYRVHLTNDTLAFATGGNERMRIDAVGNVSIGTTVMNAPLRVAGGEIRIIGGGAFFDQPISVYGHNVSASKSYNAFFSTNSSATNTAHIDSVDDLWLDGSLEVDDELFVEGFASFSGPLEVTTGYVKIPDGTLANPGLRFQSDPDTGLYRPTTDITSFVNAGAERMRIDAAGDVAIGTTTTLNRFTVAGGNVGIGTTNAEALLDVTGIAGNNQLVSIASANNTEYFAIEKSGNVGIGVAGGDTRLTVRNFDNTLDGDKILALESSVGIEYFAFRDNGASFSNTLEFSGGQLLGYVSDTAANPFYTWSTNNDTGMFNPGGDYIGFTTNGNEAMRIDSDGDVAIGYTGIANSNQLSVMGGNVGIGTTNATGLLDIIGAGDPLLRVASAGSGEWLFTVHQGGFAVGMTGNQGSAYSDNFNQMVSNPFTQNPTVTALIDNSDDLFIGGGLEVQDGAVFTQNTSVSYSSGGQPIVFNVESTGDIPALLKVESGHAAGLELYGDKGGLLNAYENPYILLDAVSGDKSAEIGIVRTNDRWPTDDVAPAFGLTNGRGNNLIIGTRTDDGIQFATNGAVSTTIDVEGNVGIGTYSPATFFHIASSGVNILSAVETGNVGINTTNPDAKFTINADDGTPNGERLFNIQESDGTDLFTVYDDRASLSATTGALLAMGREPDTDVQGDELVGRVNFYTHDPQLSGNNIYASILTAAEGTTNTNAAKGYMAFYTTSSTVGGSPLERLRIDSSGHLNVNTGVVQVSGLSPAAYNRLGTNSTGHAADINGTSDLLISDALEVDGKLYADIGIEVGGNIVLNGNSITGGGSFTGGSISVSGGGGFGASVSADEFIGSPGGAADPSFTFSSNNQTGMFAGDGVDFTVGGTEIGDFRAAGLYLTGSSMDIDVTGYIDAAEGFRDNGNTGIDTNCASNEFLGNQTTSGGIVTAGSCETDDIDYAERFFAGQSGIAPGDIVVADPNGSLDIGDSDAINNQAVVRSSGAYQATTLGIISTKPGLIIGSKGSAEHPAVEVALAGRVPVKVNEQNGPVSVGDMIAASDEAGVGMRATQAGTVVGMALTEPYASGSQEYVVAFINPQFWMPTYDLGDLEELASGSEVFGDGSALSALFNQFVDYLRDVVLTVRTLIAGQVQTDELCVGTTCVNEAQLIELLDDSGVEATTMTPSPTPVPDEDEEVIEEETGTGGDTEEEVTEEETVTDEEPTDEEPVEEGIAEEEPAQDEPAGDTADEPTPEDSGDTGSETTETPPSNG